MRHVELYIFACGHGDTLLIRLPDDRWVLVDCYLPGDARKRFFDFVADKKIHHLAAVFQTHPDYDHYLGMRAVLTHFVEQPGKSVGTYLDSGLNAQQIKTLMSDPARPARQEYPKLQRALRTWRDEKKIDWCELDAQRVPFSPRGLAGQIDFVPIAPDLQFKRKLTESSIKKMSQQGTAKLEANDLSLVLSLVVNHDKTTFNALLAADAGTEALTRAFAVWKEHTAQRKISDCFDVVKVSHHGSIKNHLKELCDHGPHADPNRKIAAISAGQRPALPDRRVIEDYLDARWTVMLTTIRKAEHTNRVVDLHVKKANTTAFHENTIELLWEDGGTFKFQPGSAVVDKADSRAYDMAKE
jgi:beta-lactamase superfamily II metal-dependent hydrolase